MIKRYSLRAAWLFGALLLSFIVIGGPAAAQTSFVSASNGTFVYQGQNFRFIGVNIRKMAYMSAAEQDAQIAAARAMGARVIRVYAARNDQSPAQIAAALKALLGRVGTGNDIKFIVTLTDFYQASPYRLGSDDGYYQGGYLGPAWFQSQYRNFFRPYVQQLVSDPQLATDPRIFAWELGNELKAGSAADMINFVRDVGCAIQGWDTNHMVSSGFISAWHATNGGDNYADDLHLLTCASGARAFDYGTIHGYNNEWVNPPCSGGTCPNGYERQDQDYGWWRANNVAYVLGETSFSASGCPAFPGGSLGGTAIPAPNPSRLAATQATTNKFIDEYGADGVLQWGFRAGGSDADSDCYSMTQSFGDWQALFDFYKAKAASLGTITPPTPTPPGPTPTPPPTGSAVHAFVLGLNNVLWQRVSSNGAWAAWEQLTAPPGGATSEPAAARGNGRTDVFIRGGDNGLWQRTNTGSGWGNWISLGGGLSAAPDVTAQAGGEFDVIIKGNDNHLYRRAFRNGAWANWEFLSSPNSAGATSDPAIASENGRLVVFVKGSDNALWRRENAGAGWGGWISMGGGLTSAPDAASYGPGHMDVVVRGSDNALYHKVYLNGAWSDWAALGAPPSIATSNPSVAAAGGRVDVFVRGSDNALWQRTNTGSGWGAWQTVGGVLTAGPDAASN